MMFPHSSRWQTRLTEYWREISIGCVIAVSAGVITVFAYRKISKKHPQNAQKIIVKKLMQKHTQQHEKKQKEDEKTIRNKGYSDESLTDEALFLGLDCSTQSMTAIVIDSSAKVVVEHSFAFDDELPHYDTKGGVHIHNDSSSHTNPFVNRRITSPTLMFFEALEKIFYCLQRDKRLNLSKIICISGSAQQHGSVFWATGVNEILSNLDSTRSLAAQLRRALAFRDSPSWMDSSSTPYCVALEKAVGGAQAVADITGSRAYERFSGNQIAMLSHMYPTQFARCERISLISSALASVVCGHIVPVDVGDASGMNLMNIRSRKWSPLMLSSTNVDRIADLLGPDPIDSTAVIGTVSPYMQQRFGFSSTCIVSAFTGDNPSTIAGLGLLNNGDVCISLGTSDTILAIVSSPISSGKEGHIFINPVDSSSFIAMQCFRNGSSAREDVRARCTSRSWNEFTDKLSQTQPGNDGYIGFFFVHPEITPRIPHSGIFVFDKTNQIADSFDNAFAEVRAVIEGQCLSMRFHAEAIGMKQPKRLIVTGGGSINQGILQIVADVFGVSVHTVDSGSSTAAFGAALRALHTSRGANERFESIAQKSCVQLSLQASPQMKHIDMYNDMLKRYAYLEAQVIQANT